MRNNIINLIENWGKNKRGLPERNSELKESVVLSFRASGEEKGINSKPWFSIGLFGTAVLTALVLLVNNPITKNIDGSEASKVANFWGGQTKSGNEIADKAQLNFEEPPAYNPKPAGNVQSEQPTSNSSELRVPSYLPSATGGNTGTVPTQNDSEIVEKRTSGWEGGVNLPVYPSVRDFNPVPLNDSREFLKYYYGATIKTRNIGEVSGRLQTVIRGYGGRVDSVNSGEKFGSISFVVPKKSLETFKAEVKQIAGAKFIVENIATQNYLSDKRNIEQGLSSASENLGQIKKDKEVSARNHTLAVKTINDGINSLSSQISQVRTDIVSGRGNKQELEAWLASLESQKAGLVASLNQENARYTQVVSRLDTQIISVEQGVKELNKQDGQLVENVETVNGTLILTWISIWSLINIYTNGFWLPGMLVILAVITYFISRRREKRITLQVPEYSAE